MHESIRVNREALETLIHATATLYLVCHVDVEVAAQPFQTRLSRQVDTVADLLLALVDSAPPEARRSLFTIETMRRPDTQEPNA